MIDPKVARRFKDLNLFQQREEMGNGDLIPALGEGGYSSITMLVETLQALIFLLLWHKIGKKSFAPAKSW